MANIDQLSIEINADAEKATSAISKLTSNLQELSRSLKDINTNSITKFARSMESLAKTGRATDAATQAIEGMAKALSSSFGIKSKEGIEAVKDSMMELGEATKRFQQSGMNDSFAEAIGDAEKNVASIVRDYAKIEKQLDDDTKAVVDFVKNTRQGSVSITNFAKEFGDNFAQMKRTLGRGFTSELDATKKGIQDFEEYIQSLKEATSTSMFDNLAPDAAFEKLSSVMESAKNSTMSYTEAVQNGAINFNDAISAVVSYSASIDRLVATQDKLTKENGIDALVNSLKGLSEVSVPDFSSFAHAIETLNRVNVEKVTRNLERVKETLAEGTAKAEEMVTALVPVTSVNFDSFSSLADHIMNSSELAQNLADRIMDGSFIAAEMAQKFTEVTDIITTSAEEMTTLATYAELTSGYVDKMTAAMWSFRDAWANTIETTGFSIVDEDVIDTVAREIPEAVGYIETSMQSAEEASNRMWDSLRSLGEEFRAIEPYSEAFSDSIDTDKIGNGFDVLKQKCKALSTTLLATAEVIKKISEAFRKLADIGVKAFKTLLSSLQGLKKFGQFLINDFNSKTEGIKTTFANMSSALQNEMSRLSAFWQRTLRTFTFMLVRKAITAVIKDVKKAIDELVLFEKHLGNLSGGAFNNSVSEILADFHLIGRAIVAAFEPLINWVVPILNAVANQIANMLSTLGEFFAAFTGQNYFVKAKKTVVDYASTLEDEEDTAEDAKDANDADNDSLDDKEEKLKDIKKLLLGIDELNVLPKQDDDDDKDKTKKKKEKEKKQKTPKDSGINYKDAYEEKEVSEGMKNLVEKIKKILADLFEPIKTAWNKVKPYLDQAWNYMKTSVLKLAADIGKAFLEAWKSPITEHIFENIFTIIGDLMTVVGNLANRFREAWNSITDNGSTLGVSIFTNLLSIIDILSTHVQNVTAYMKKWSEEIDFNPLLNGINNVLAALKPVAEFLGGVFEDVMENIVLEHIRYLIEEGIPHLCHAIEEVINAFDFEKLRTQLQPIEIAFENMRQQIHEGLVNAMKNLGVAIGQWTQTENFQKFLDGVQHFMEQITAERVEKLFTGLGLGILEIAKGLADFIGSEEFKKWCDDFFAWYDSFSAEDISKFFYGIAAGIGKLAMGLAKFVFSDNFKEFIKKISEWYQGLSADDIANGLEKIGKAIAGFTFASFVGGGVAAFLSFIGKLVTFSQLSEIASGLSTLAGGASGGGIAGVGTAASGAAGGLSGFASALSSIAAPVAIAVAAVASLMSSYGGLQGVIEKVASIFTALKQYAAQVAQALKFDETVNHLKEAFSNLYTALGTLKPIWDLLFLAIQAVATFLIGTLTPLIQGVVEQLSGVINVVSAVVQAIGGLIEGVAGAFTGNTELMAQGCEDFFAAIPLALEGAVEVVKGVLSFFGAPLIGLITSFAPDTIQAIQEWVNNIIGFFQNLKYQLIGDPIVVDMVNGILDWFNTLFTDGLQWISDLVSGVLEFFTQLGTDALTKAGELVTNVVGKFEELKSGAEEKFNAFKEGAATIFDDAKTAVVEKAGDLKDGAIEKYNALKKDALEKWDDIKKGASEKFGDAKKKAVTAASEMKKNVSEAFGDLAKKAKEKFGEIPKTVNEKFKDMKDKARDKMSDTIDMCKQKLDKMKEKFQKFDLTKMGENIIKGFWGGLKNIWSQVVSWASQKLADFKSKFAQILQIHSPSRVFMKYGEYTVEGFNLGLQKYSDTTGKVVEKWVDSFAGMSVTVEPDVKTNMSNIPLVAEQKYENTNGLTKEELVDVLNDFAALIRSNQQRSGETRVVLEMDGRQLYEQVVRQDRQQMLRTGRSALAY